MKKLVALVLTAAMIVPGSVAAAAETAVVSFGDVPQEAWYAGDVAKVSGLGVMGGTEEGLFEPDAELSRAALVTALYALAGKPKVSSNLYFTDVIVNQWYSNAVVWSVESGLTVGYEDGSFGVFDTITRQDLAVILTKYLSKVEGIVLNTTARQVAFDDFGDVDTYAAVAVQDMYKLWIITGTEGKYDGYVNPGSGVTRAQAASAISKMIGIVERNK